MMMMEMQSLNLKEGLVMMTSPVSSQGGMTSGHRSTTPEENTPLEVVVPSAQEFISEEVFESEIPIELRSEQFDAVLIYADADVTEALAFKDILEKCIQLKDGKYAKICVLDRGDNLCEIQSRFRHLEVACKLSTYMFLLLTKNFMDDSWADFQKDQCLQDSLYNPSKKWCAIPVHTQSKGKCEYETPWGLRSLKPLNINTMLTNKVPLGEVDVEQLSPGSINRDFIKSITQLFNCRLDMKQVREQTQRRNRDGFISMMKRVKFEQRQAAEHAEAMKLRKLEKELQQIQIGDSGLNSMQGNGIDFKESREMRPERKLTTENHFHFHGNTQAVQIGDSNTCKIHPHIGYSDDHQDGGTSNVTIIRGSKAPKTAPDQTASIPVKVADPSSERFYYPETNLGNEKADAETQPKQPMDSYSDDEDNTFVKTETIVRVPVKSAWVPVNIEDTSSGQFCDCCHENIPLAVNCKEIAQPTDCPSVEEETQPKTLNLILR